MHPLIITLDGPAGSGKSTVARRLASKLGLAYLDTGAMYRGIAATALDGGIQPAQEHDKVIELAQHAFMRFDWMRDPPRLHINQKDVTLRLRDPDVTQAVSEIASMPEVRKVLVAIQKQIGRDHPRLVTEGRDQGSVVFPQANVKFYMTASPQVRARRRAAELKAAQKPCDEADILRQIMERDDRDMHRSDGPLIKPHNAIEIDTSPLALDQVVERLEYEVRIRTDLWELQPPASDACTATS